MSASFEIFSFKEVYLKVPTALTRFDWLLTVGYRIKFPASTDSLIRVRKIIFFIVFTEANMKPPDLLCHILRSGKQVNMAYKKNKHLFNWLLLSVLGWLIICQGLFIMVQNSLGQKVIGSVQNQLRQELEHSNFHFLARSINDYNKSGDISCAVLEKVNDVHARILDLRYMDKFCSNSKVVLNFLLIGSYQDVQLQAINGDIYRFQFISNNPVLFGLALWSFRLLGIAAIFASALAFKAYEEKRKIAYEAEVAISNEIKAVTKQVAHDIRSPLSALTMVTGMLKEIPEDKRVLIRQATQRINDIANDLLQKGNQRSGVEKEDNAQLSSGPLVLTTEFIPALADILISEKRMQFREFTNLEIDVDLKYSFGAFAKVNANELKRVLSNLVNNSVEAFDNHQGKITIGVRKSEDNGQQVSIFIQDNGKGIPKHILEKLGHLGVTHGKSGTQSGSGLGVYHAKKTVESFGGEFLIESTEGQGTTMNIVLPLAETPPWFAQEINLIGKNHVVSLDDDSSIHQIWADRLVELGITGIEHVKFQSSDAFEKYMNANIKRLKESIFLIDYELLNQSRTGLQIIEDLVIEKYSVLVTSRYEDQDIQVHAKKLNLKILPKTLSGFVPITK